MQNRTANSYADLTKTDIYSSNFIEHRDVLKMNCPKCGKKMTQTNQSPAVFIAENVSEKFDSLIVSKIMVCSSKHSDYSYFILEDENNLKVTGFGASDYPLNIRESFILNASPSVNEHNIEPLPLVTV